MVEKDYFDESEEEFFEDFGSGVTDEEIEALLVEARETSDVKLRQLIKELQYVRCLMRELTEQFDTSQENQLLPVQSLALFYVQAINNKQ